MPRDPWILSREPTLSDAMYRRLVDLAADQGYDTTRLVRTPQPPRLGPHALARD